MTKKEPEPAYYGDSELLAGDSAEYMAAEQGDQALPPRALRRRARSSSSSLPEALRRPTKRKLGVNAYSFMINKNGHILFHPDHRPMRRVVTRRHNYQYGAVPNSSFSEYCVDIYSTYDTPETIIRDFLERVMKEPSETAERYKWKPDSKRQFYNTMVSVSRLVEYTGLGLEEACCASNAFRGVPRVQPGVDRNIK
ncbi:hypothetical protein V5799_000163 [Amblyomma americanum]|uniref:Uncharacterized protein n=1 Tax=Amblyomma americanum TaxID=6943 RepID=A0AAQ4D3U4_AMBAM